MEHRLTQPVLERSFFFIEPYTKDYFANIKLQFFPSQGYIIERSTII
jgi:hypothetical protein